MGRGRDRLKAFATEWLAPAWAGLLGAALLIAGVEAGGWVAWASIASAWLGLGLLVVWATRTLRRAYEDLAAWPDAPEDDRPDDEP